MNKGRRRSVSIMLTVVLLGFVAAAIILAMAETIINEPTDGMAAEPEGAREADP